MNIQDTLIKEESRLVRDIVNNATLNDVVNFKENFSSLIQSKIDQHPRVVAHANAMEKYSQYSDAFAEVN